MPSCAIRGCARPSKYRSDIGRLCSLHYQRAKNHGDPMASVRRHDRSTPPDTCRQCGGPRGEGYAKWYCSARCRGRYYNRVDEGRTWPCADCGAELTSETNRSDAVRCSQCSHTSPPLSARQLAQRDGTTCAICLEPVDMSRSGGRDPIGPTADHIVPRAKGGPNIAENLQLTHLRCNCVKRDGVLTPDRIATLADEVRHLADQPAVAPLADTCGAGHRRTPENGRWEPRGWHCRICKRAAQRARYDAETTEERAARYARANANSRARYAARKAVRATT